MRISDWSSDVCSSDLVQTGMSDVVVAGGVESMSNVEHYSTDIRKGVRAGNLTLHDRLTRGRLMSQPVERFGVISGMIETAENLAKDYGISREDRKSVVSGKSGSVRVNLGGRRTINKKTTDQSTIVKLLN